MGDVIGLHHLFTSLGSLECYGDFATIEDDAAGKADLAEE
jgi:hypothetical protein